MTPPTPPPYPITDACRPVFNPRCWLWFPAMIVAGRSWSEGWIRCQCEDPNASHWHPDQPTAPEPVNKFGPVAQKLVTHENVVHDKPVAKVEHSARGKVAGSSPAGASISSQPTPPQAQGTPLYPNVTRENKLKSSRERAKKHRDERRQYDRDRDPIKKNARSMIRKRINRGKLKRGICEVCGNPKTDAHHDDYTKPLEVRWLCRFHHKQLHKKESK